MPPKAIAGLGIGVSRGYNGCGACEPDPRARASRSGHGTPRPRRRMPHVRAGASLAGIACPEVGGTASGVRCGRPILADSELRPVQSRDEPVPPRRKRPCPSLPGLPSPAGRRASRLRRARRHRRLHRRPVLRRSGAARATQEASPCSATATATATVSASCPSPSFPSPCGLAELVSDGCVTHRTVGGDATGSFLCRIRYRGQASARRRGGFGWV